MGKVCYLHLYLCISLDPCINLYSYTHSCVDCVWASGTDPHCEGVSGLRRLFPHWADTNWDLPLTILLPGIFSYFWVVTAFPKAASFLTIAACEASPCFPANNRHCIFWSCALLLHCIPLITLVWGVFIMSRTCRCYVWWLLGSRGWQFTWEDEGYPLWHTWKIGDHVNCPGSVVWPPSETNQWLWKCVNAWYTGWFWGETTWTCPCLAPRWLHVTLGKWLHLSSSLSSGADDWMGQCIWRPPAVPGRQQASSQPSFLILLLWSPIAACLGFPYTICVSTSSYWHPCSMWHSKNYCANIYWAPINARSQARCFTQLPP